MVEFPMSTYDSARQSLIIIRAEMVLPKVTWERLQALRQASRDILNRWPKLREQL